MTLSVGAVPMYGEPPITQIWLPSETTAMPCRGYGIHGPFIQPLPSVLEISVVCVLVSLSGFSPPIANKGLA